MTLGVLDRCLCPVPVPARHLRRHAAFFRQSTCTSSAARSGWPSSTTIGALILGFPTAYFIATKPPNQRNLWLFLITLPFWTNLLIRTYAILLIIRDEGLINFALVGSGLRSTPLNILYTDTAVFIGLIYSYLPFMVLPLYASLEKLDFRLVEAAYDLYATRLAGAAPRSSFRWPSPASWPAASWSSFPGLAPTSRRRCWAAARS